MSSKKRTFVRKSDGVRVYAEAGRTTISFSVPRVLGLQNWKQDRVSRKDFLCAFRECTENLLPQTTKEGAINDRYWGITRLDLARNFVFPVSAVIEAYRSAYWPHSRTNKRFMVIGKRYETLDFRGSKSTLAIYDKLLQINWLKRNEINEGSRGRLPGNRVGRVELRLKGPATLKRLVPFLKPVAEGGLPIFVTGKDGKKKLARFAVSFKRLHRAFIEEVSALHPSPTFLPGAVSSAHEMGLIAMARFPERFPLSALNMKSSTLNTYRRQMTSFLVTEAHCDLLRLCYPRYFPNAMELAEANTPIDDIIRPESMIGFADDDMPKGDTPNKANVSLPKPKSARHRTN